MTTPTDPQPTSSPGHDPNWLHEFEELANQELEDGSSCEQVHPIVQNWYENLMEQELPTARESVMQALACLTTEIMNDIPDDIFEVMTKHVGEEELAGWIETVLTIGRAFEIGLNRGDLDDL